jgi:hypothetical protein
MLPVMESAIQSCDFVCIDLEMTGLFLTDSSMHYLDEMEDRYREVLESARRFLPMQLGISCFTRMAGADGTAFHYEAQSFNIYLFPLASADNNPRFECEVVTDPEQRALLLGKPPPYPLFGRNSCSPS